MGTKCHLSIDTSVESKYISIIDDGIVQSNGSIAWTIVTTLEQCS